MASVSERGGTYRPANVRESGLFLGGLMLGAILTQVFPVLGVLLLAGFVLLFRVGIDRYENTAN